MSNICFTNNSSVIQFISNMEGVGKVYKYMQVYFRIAFPPGWVLI